MRGLLVLLLASPCLAEAPSMGEKAAADILEAARAFDEHFRKLEGVLAALAGNRAAFPSSGDRGRLMVEREALRREMGAGLERSNALRSDYRHAVQAAQTVAFAEGVQKRLAHRPITPGRLEALLVADEHRSTEMHAREDRLARAYAKEEAQFAAELERMELEDGVRRNRRLGGLAALALAGAAAMLLWPRSRSASPPPAPPAAALDLQTGRLLGRGSAGEVREAFDRTLQRRVAVKRLRPELLAEPAAAERLLREARAVAALEHPNIVTLHSVERSPDGAALVFELIDGETLEAALGRDGPLGAQRARRVLKEAAAALDHAHAKGVVHRDLRPANIMLTRAGEAKVMDFGLASEAKRTLARLTRATAWGSPAYMAPEQELGAAAPAVDVWALAVCFYQMLTGEVPFKGPDFLTQKRERLYAPPSALVPALPRGLDAVFARAFDPDPARRFPSAAALAAAAEAA